MLPTLGHGQPFFRSIKETDRAGKPELGQQTCVITHFRPLAGRPKAGIHSSRKDEEKVREIDVNDYNEIQLHISTHV